MEIDDDSTVHRLEASGPQTGGLVVKKKDSGAVTFKVPKPSLLGLDRLAAQKRKERDDAKRLISFKESEYDDVAASPGSDSAIRTPDVSSVHKLNRQYRELRVETPSHSGGVSEKARDRLAERSEKDKRGVYISSKDKKRGRDDDRDRNRRERERDRDRRDRDRDRRNRDRDSGYRDSRDRDRDSSRRSDRRGRPDSERSLHTPRFKDEPRTPSSGKILDSWDDDDDKAPVKKSQWDFPTPKDGSDSKRSDWSTRSSSSSIYRSKNKSNIEDDTPRPTPAHKYNAWANDRKRSGATPQTGIVFYKIHNSFPFVEILINSRLTQVAPIRSNLGRMRRSVTCGKRNNAAWIANGITSTKATTMNRIHSVERATPTTSRNAKINWNKRERSAFRHNSVRTTRTMNCGNGIVC